MSRLLALLAALGFLGACESAYPEVVVVNRTAEAVQLRKVTFSGCEWTGVLAYGASTPVGRCLPGEDRVHFEKLDAAAWALKQAEDGTIDGLARTGCDGGVCVPSGDGGHLEPLWFAYQTRALHAVGTGAFRVIEITLDGIEQDFSVPGPYGH